MADFVLVAGAWLGAWAWDEVVPPLRAAGHGTHPLTLSGLAEKRGVPAGQQTHVQDIVDEVERGDLRDVVLVGHSYSGIPVGSGRGADRRPVDPGGLRGLRGAGRRRAFASGWWQGRRRSRRRSPTTAATGRRSPRPTSTVRVSPTSRSPADREAPRRTRAHADRAGRADPAAGRASGDVRQVPARRARAQRHVAKLLTSDTWRLVTMDTGHWPMFSQPTELARILLAETS